MLALLRKAKKSFSTESAEFFYGFLSGLWCAQWLSFLVSALFELGLQRNVNDEVNPGVLPLLWKVVYLFYMVQFKKVAQMEYRVQVHSGGRFVLPSKLRKELQIKTGDEIILQLENGSIRMVPLHLAVAIAQQAVKKYVPKGTSLVDDLIQARRAEAAHE